MADVFSKRKRSEVMARIRGRGNKDTELALAKLLRRHNITGWRRHIEIRHRAVASVYDRRSLRKVTAGARRAPLQRTAQRSVPTFRVRPDFVFPKLKLAIFVDGCFWHGCPQHATWPASRAAWWRRKLEGNRARDRRVNRALRREGWRVLRIWEHSLQWAVKDAQHQARLVRRVTEAVRLRGRPAVWRSQNSRAAETHRRFKKERAVRRNHGDSRMR